MAAFVLKKRILTGDDSAKWTRDR